MVSEVLNDVTLSLVAGSRLYVAVEISNKSRAMLTSV